MSSFISIIGLTLLAALPQGTVKGPAMAPAKERSRWVVQKSSSLDITGHTNVNHFNCGVAQYSEPDTLSFLQEEEKGQGARIPLHGTLRVSVDMFDCRSRMMTNEFKKALLFSQYPQLTIIFLNLETMPSFSARPETVKGLVLIEIAGTCKEFEIEYTSTRADRSSMVLTGSRQLTFHDFGLKPPHKMGGLIKVSDSLNVRFTLCLRLVE